MNGVKFVDKSDMCHQFSLKCVEVILQVKVGVDHLDKF